MSTATLTPERIFTELVPDLGRQLADDLLRAHARQAAAADTTPHCWDVLCGCREAVAEQADEVLSDAIHALTGISVGHSQAWTDWTDALAAALRGDLPWPPVPVDPPMVDPWPEAT